MLVRQTHFGFVCHIGGGGVEVSIRSAFPSKPYTSHRPVKLCSAAAPVIVNAVASMGVQVASMDEDELFVFAKQIQAPFSLVQEVAKNGRLPVVNFAAGGIATPADAALMMQLGVDGETPPPTTIESRLRPTCGLESRAVRCHQYAPRDPSLLCSVLFMQFSCLETRQKNVQHVAKSVTAEVE